MDGRPIVQVEVAADEAELAADDLWQAGPSAVAEEALPDGRVRLTADPERLDQLDPRWAPTVLQLDDDAYLDVWRSWARTVRAGRSFVLHPSWHPDPPLAPGDRLVRLDPGRAFGTGSHPSTRLVLAALEDRLRPGDRVLDVGCGSGVLSVAAALLGAASVVAIDVDPSATAATVANAGANGVAAMVGASETPLADVEGPFDIVLANIGAATLRELAPELARAVRLGGVLVLAGLLEHQADGVVALLTGCREVDRPEEAGWAAPVLVRER